MLRRRSAPSVMTQSPAFLPPILGPGPSRASFWNREDAARLAICSAAPHSSASVKLSRPYTARLEPRFMR